MPITTLAVWDPPQPVAITNKKNRNKQLSMSPLDEMSISQGSCAIQEGTDFEESQQTQSQLELTQLTQTQVELTPDESSNMLPLSASSPPLSPPPIVPWGRLVPSRGVRLPIDLMPSQKEYWMGRSSSKCDVPMTLAKNASNNSKEMTMMAWAHSMISNKHCRIFCDNNGSIYVEDQSGNGTYVNQTTALRKGQMRLLHSGDEICLVNPNTLRTKINSSRVLQKVLLQFTFIFVQPSKPRRSCVNPKAMKYRPAPPTSTTSRRIETLYELREKIGDGTSGQVRRVIHRQTGKEFAVKVISLRRQLDTKHMEQEVSLMRTLDHPYIVQLVDVFVHTGVAMYLVMELVSGGDLFDRIVQQEKYTEVDARRAMRRLLSAIHYLHETCHIVHRDLKPENILCASPTHVKLADFGLAKIVKGDNLKTFCGTPQYFAPEVLRRRNTVTGQGRYGKPADMWSLGVILYILLTGNPPFGSVDFMGEDDNDEDPYTTLKFDEEHHHWDAMPMAKNLVQNLLKLDPKQRLSVQQACDHPWINMEDGDTHVHPLDDPAVTSRKRLFDDQSKQLSQESNNDAEEKKEDTNYRSSQEVMSLDEGSHSSASSNKQRKAKGNDVSLFQDAISKEHSLPNLADLNVLSTSSKMNTDDEDNDRKATDKRNVASSTSSTNTEVENEQKPPDPPVTPQDGDVKETLPSTPMADLNQRGNRFRNRVLDQQKDKEALSPEAQNKPKKAAVTPNLPAQAGDEDAVSQFSESDHCSIESFPESPKEKKRPLEESDDVEEPDAKRRNKNSRQTTLRSWFVKKP
eukprot:scaffold5966_cov118-Cylindrotheca_fusiformis.AAC.16